MPRMLAALLLFVPAAALAEGGQFSPESPPAALVPAVARADAPLKAYSEGLQAKLMSALKEGGPAAAVNICRDEAPRLAAEVARAHGVTLGRTSDRLRNPANTPPAWAVRALKQASGKKAGDVPSVGFDLGNRVGLLRPIAVKPACLGCHGPAAALSPAVKASLAKSYPKDRAVGYAEGDFRGFLWAETRK